MRESFSERLRCPACHTDGSLALDATDRDEREVRAGTLTCSACGQAVAVRDGIVEALLDPPEHVVAESEGLTRFAERMTEHGWTEETIVSLPFLDHGYWYTQARSITQLLESVDFQPGQRVLDLGSNTCWAASHFAERDLDVTALDISTDPMQGLGTAELFFKHKGVFFERVLGTMTDLPLASESVDYVFCCQVLHHNGRADLGRTMAEANRVLKPEGELLVVNEPLRTLRDRAGNHTEEFDVDEFEGNEHAYAAPTYLLAAARAGFIDVRVLEPTYRPFFGDTHLELPPGTSAPRALGEAVAFGLRPRRFARRAYLAWVNTVTPRSSISFRARRPRHALSFGERAKLKLGSLRP